MASSIASSSRLLLSSGAVRPRRLSPPALRSAAAFMHSSSPNHRASGGQHVGRSSGAASLSWDEYLKLRRSRRLAGMVTTIPTTALAAAGSGAFFLTQELDPTNAIAGIDPVYVSFAAVLAFTGVGWLIGPTLGSSLWTMMHSSKLPAIREKDGEFYEHIKRNRVDPSRQSVQNPVPDFYGEKVGSIKQYRQWLRDQAAYRRKAAHGLKDEF
ncbi:mitochondrial import protein Pam17 [Tilletiaria anomala UBC 951]|uniref:Presequence translocated-associated motor subunit PAM17 n=1 Tax=Tilletiaria anomala (strain ATCC 24038 / CBS 436.72 / UBC 951) TaxID=1037660 RepID=A0A066W860_TILAU|nr:mitochondrial import protein Pam17 [Tilletiaria anomala UBC 951]KDN49896.1 mitochondrial import protein Pam17 [Tilletiaria anomala UBC 951]